MSRDRDRFFEIQDEAETAYAEIDRHGATSPVGKAAQQKIARRGDGWLAEVKILRQRSAEVPGPADPMHLAAWREQLGRLRTEREALVSKVAAPSVFQGILIGPMVQEQLGELDREIKEYVTKIRSFEQQLEPEYEGYPP
jgi:hypothetical protein